MGYQPKLTAETLDDLKNENLPENVDEPRKTFQRLLSIIKHIKNNGNLDKNHNLLDVGCNDGVFSNSMASILGINCLGIDNNNIYNAKHVSEKPLVTAEETAKCLKISNSYFFQSDVLDFFNKTDEKYNYSLVLSVMHNLMLYNTFRNGNAVTIQDMENCLKKIWSNTINTMFFETDTTIGQSYGWGKNHLEDKIKECCPDCEIKKITETPAYNGSRGLYAISRVKNFPVKNKKFYAKYINGSGTENFYIEANKDYFKKTFGVDIYNGSINLKTNFPISFNYDIHNVKINHLEKTYSVAKCKLNGISGFVAQTNKDKTICEFFTDKFVSNIKETNELTMEN